MGTNSVFLGFVFLSGLMGLCIAQGNVHYYDFVLSESNFTRLCSTKRMLTVNDSFPGPVIRVHKGDTVYVNVHNQGLHGVTIHWHGVKQPRNPWSDGPEYITQCPIEPGTNFTYEVIFSREEGTVWWHAHSGWTRASIHGAIIVYPAIGTTYPFPEPDGEEVIVLASWYTGDLYKMVEEALEDGTNLPQSSAYTINGQPGDFCACSMESTYRRLVEYNKTYILRVVNAAMNVELFLSIAEHNFTVVAMDAAYIKPMITSYILISPGQTMDILVTTNQSLGHYYMVARQYDNVDKLPSFDKVNVSMIWQYEGNYTPPLYPSFPTTTLPSYEDFSAAQYFTNRIKSLASKEYPINVPQNISTHMYITAGTNIVMYKDNETANLGASLNNISWVNPSTDILLAYYRDITGIYTTDFPDFPPHYFDFTGDDLPEHYVITSTGTKVKVLNYNEAVELVFQDTTIFDAPQDHPMHFHGYSFYVVGRGYGNFDNETDPQKFNLVDPPELNTVAIPKKGWVAVRFFANNPGVWFWHCHLDKHLTWGMNTVFIVKNGGTPETSILPMPAYMPPCRVPFGIKRQESNDSTGKENKVDMI